MNEMSRTLPIFNKGCCRDWRKSLWEPHQPAAASVPRFDSPCPSCDIAGAGRDADHGRESCAGSAHRGHERVLARGRCQPAGRHREHGTQPVHDRPVRDHQPDRSLEHGKTADGHARSGDAPLVVKADPQIVGDLPASASATATFHVTVNQYAAAGTYQLPVVSNYTYLTRRTRKAARP